MADNVVADGDLLVWENVAIGRYLNEKYDCSSHCFGATLERRARINQFAQWYADTPRLGGELKVEFNRRTAVLKGTEAHSGHNKGIPHLGEDDDYIAQVEA